MLKRIGFVIGIVVVGLLLLNKVVIPHSKKPQLRIDDEARVARLEKGREVIMRACEVAGGMQNWLAKQDVSFHLSDHWSVPVRFWPASKVETNQYYLLHRGAGRVEMNTRHGIHQWGLENGVPWALLNGKLDSDGLRHARYAISTSIYFFELPFNFLNRGAYPEFIGEETREGRIYDKVYVSFGLNGGNYPNDWYVAYFDHLSGRLTSIIYTSIEKSPSFVEYEARFEDYQTIDGLEFPTRGEVKMLRPITGIPIHRWQISAVHFNSGISEAFFQPPAVTAPVTVSMNK